MRKIITAMFMLFIMLVCVASAGYATITDNVSANGINVVTGIAGLAIKKEYSELSSATLADNAITLNELSFSDADGQRAYPGAPEKSTYIWLKNVSNVPMSFTLQSSTVYTSAADTLNLEKLIQIRLQDMGVLGGNTVNHDTGWRTINQALNNPKNIVAISTTLAPGATRNIKILVRTPDTYYKECSSGSNGTNCPGSGASPASGDTPDVSVMGKTVNGINIAITGTQN